MPGRVPGIHDFLVYWNKDVDGRVKPGHDDLWEIASLRFRTCGFIIPRLVWAAFLAYYTADHEG